MTRTPFYTDLGLHLFISVRSKTSSSKSKIDQLKPAINEQTIEIFFRMKEEKIKRRRNTQIPEVLTKCSKELEWLDSTLCRINLAKELWYRKRCKRGGRRDSSEKSSSYSSFWDEIPSALILAHVISFDVIPYQLKVVQINNNLCHCTSRLFRNSRPNDGQIPMGSGATSSTHHFNTKALV